MNYKYTLKRIKEADECAVKAYNNLNKYRFENNVKYLNMCTYYITEIDEILNELEIDINTKLEEEKNEQLQ